MKVSKWVDFGTEVDVLIDANDIAGAIGEAWQHVTRDRFEEDGPTRSDVISAMTRSLHFFKALKDEHIADLTDQQREVLAKLLTEQADRFRIGGLFKTQGEGSKALKPSARVSFTK